MPVQISLRLPEALLDRVDDVARRRDISRSTALRELLEQALEAAAALGAARPVDRVAELVGCYDLEVSDLGARHREHLRDLLADRR